MPDDRSMTEAERDIMARVLQAIDEEFSGETMGQNEYAVMVGALVWSAATLARHAELNALADVLMKIPERAGLAS